eukprot:276634-Chlamydomonas_euryale.AAC.1
MALVEPPCERAAAHLLPTVCACVHACMHACVRLSLAHAPLSALCIHTHTPPAACAPKRPAAHTKRAHPLPFTPMPPVCPAPPSLN